MQIRQMLSSVSFGLSGPGGGTKPSLFSLRDLDIRMPMQMLNLAVNDKGGKAALGKPSPARQPRPNVMILINNRNDAIAVNATYINAPHRTLVIVAHGNPNNGVQKPDGKGYYSTAQLATEIKQKLGTKLSQYDNIIFVSCRVALTGLNEKKPNGTYMQNVANMLGKPVYAPTEFGFVTAAGKISILGSTTPTAGARKEDFNDPGRFIRFDPGGKPLNSSALQAALGENSRASEDKAGAGAKVDDEFSSSFKLGRCVNATVSQCIRK